MINTVKQRIFVVGCPRSGTTLLQGMLASHPRMLSFPETHFFSMAYPRNRLKRLFTWPALTVQGVLENFVCEIGRPDLKREINIGLFDRDYEKSFIRILDRLTIEAAKDIWVEKTPRHLHFINEIQRRIPQVKFIHIVRDGIDVVASLYKVSNEFPRRWGFRSRGLTIAQCIRRWNNDILITNQWKGKPNHFVVKYRELVDLPTDVVKDLCFFLKIDYSEKMEKNESVFNKIVRPDEAWKKNNAKPIEKQISLFESIFNDDEKLYIKRNLLPFEC